jgi:hypothetical protein
MTDLPHQFKMLIEELRAGIATIQKAGKEHEDTIRTTSEAANKERRKIQETLSALAITPEEKTAERVQRGKEYRQQRDLKWGTWLAFVAAAIYAGIAAYQSCLMNRTYEEIQKQTKSAELSAYTACVNAQIAQATFLQVERSAIDSHAVAAATIEQAAAGIEAERAVVSFIPGTPTPEQVHDERLAVPYVIKNEGRSAALNLTVAFKSVLLHEKDALLINNKNLLPLHDNYFPAGAEIPSRPEDPKYKAMTRFVEVRDTKEQIVPFSSQETRDFFNGRLEVAVYGHMEYSDFSGVHRMRFCFPKYITKAGITRSDTKNEKICAQYNHQEDQYTACQRLLPFRQ